MAEVKLVAQPGRRPGSRQSRRLRAAGRVPGVVYGHGVQGVAVSVDGRELRHALSGGAGTNQLLELQVGSESHLAMAKVLQRHPVRHTVLHVDFQIVRRDEVVTADVPVVVVGEAKAVEREQGLVDQQLATLSVRATPGLIPSHLEVDVSNLAVGDSIRVADLNLPPGVSTELPPDEVVVMASLSRAAAVLEAAEAEEPDGGAQAPGEPSGGGSSSGAAEG